MSQWTIKIKHSKVTDDYAAVEEIQNQNWQYFIELVIEVCKSKAQLKNLKTFTYYSWKFDYGKKILWSVLQSNWKKFLFDYE